MEFFLPQFWIVQEHMGSAEFQNLSSLSKFEASAVQIGKDLLPSLQEMLRLGFKLSSHFPKHLERFGSSSGADVVTSPNSDFRKSSNLSDLTFVP
jgi:hypothetical protein